MNLALDRDDCMVVANLAPTEPLIGRSDDVRALAAAVTQSRLDTLLGPGGVGKTRLALELAAELETEYEQVKFIDLTTATVNSIGGELSDQTAMSAYEAPDADSTFIVKLELQRRAVHPHQQTLGRSSDSSLQLLSDDELQLTKCAASFAGGFSGGALTDVHATVAGR